MDDGRRKGSDSTSPRYPPSRRLLLDPSRCGVWSPRPGTRPCLRPRPPGGGTSTKRVAAVADGIPSRRCTPLNSCCCNPPVARADPSVPALIHAGAVIRLPRPTGGRAPAGRIVTIAVVLFSACRAPAGCIVTIAVVLFSSCRAPIDSCCCSPPSASDVFLVPVCTHAGGNVRRPRPTDGVNSAGSIAAVGGGRKHSCCSPISSCSCSPPDARAATPVLVLIHAEVVVHLPRPTGCRAPAGRIVTIAGVQLSSCRAPVDSYCCNPPGALLFHLPSDNVV